ncbi:DNA adenine methylase [Burkholderia stabilis]|uniref:DNA adenine methylase n=1 Tax=Burkholderia stabilis TaxID=95485 RepID=UPI00080B40BE|nr:DNA adenine methylase [Burkholderia stabilis]
MSAYFTPLRYPGGKGKVSAFVKAIFRANGIVGGTYVEPYAGGAGVAMELVIHEFAERVFINDIDRSVWAFWHSVLHETTALCDLIADTPVTIDTWHAQKEVQRNAARADALALGFSTFFLNRCNRSGILNAGVIGGYAQKGAWKLDARFNKDDLVKRIQLIGRHRERINLSRMDAVAFLQRLAIDLDDDSFIYLDPPYYEKGGDLYEHHYQHEDHAQVARAVMDLPEHVRWMVSYDDHDAIHEMYHGLQTIRYTLSYTAQARCRGREAIFFCPQLRIPELQGSMLAA